MSAADWTVIGILLTGLAAWKLRRHRHWKHIREERRRERAHQWREAFAPARTLTVEQYIALNELDAATWPKGWAAREIERFRSDRWAS